MKVRALITVIVVATVLALVATHGLAQDKKPIKIGLLYSLSGLAAVYTQGTVIGHEIAAEEINAKGGIQGAKNRVRRA